MDFINSLFGMGTTSVVLLGAFFIAFIGYALGSIQVKGVSLGTAGVFLMALLCGYLFTQPGLQNIPILSKFYIEGSASTAVTSYKFIESVGLVLFVTGVGFIAGPNFFRNLKKNAKSYVPLGAIIILIGAVCTVIFALIPGIGSDYSTGILSGALTSTPAFSAAKAVAKQEGMVALGHAVAYPFGVIGVVLFVQIVPKILHADMAAERQLIQGGDEEYAPKEIKRYLTEFDEFGFAAFGFAILLGILLGSIKIPLTGAGFDGACFSLGNTGGPLIVALILGHFGHMGRINLRIPSSTLKVFRELGLMLFLIGAGVSGGMSFVRYFKPIYFVYGIFMTLLPMVVGYIVAKHVLKMNLLNILGSITGGMTSTPALGTLIHVAGTSNVASAYAATYPIALIAVVLVSQLLVRLF